MADPRPPRTTKEPRPADPLRYTDIGDDIVAAPDRGSSTSTPCWVSVLGIVLVIFLLLLIVAGHSSGILGPGLHGGAH